MSNAEHGTLSAKQGVLARAAPGGRLLSVSLALLGPLAATTLIGLDAHQSGGIDTTLVVAGAVFTAAAAATGYFAIRRLRGLAAVGDAVRAATTHQTGTGELRVDPSLGTLALAWNQLIERDSFTGSVSSIAGPNALGSFESGLLDVLPDGIFLIGSSGEVETANAAGRVMLGLDHDAEVRATQLREFLGESAVVQLDNAVSGSLTRRVESERSGDSNTDDTFRIGIARLPESSAARVIVTIEDITRQRAAEASRGEFLAQATHELRAPLTNIRLYVDSAIDEGDEQPELRTEALNVVASETQRLERIVSDLLNIAELESGARDSHRGDVRVEQMLNDIHRAYERAASEKSLALTFEIGPQLPVLRGDRDHVAMLIQNLIGNAIKYTPNGGSVTVRAISESGQFVLDVVDTGIGIAPEEANLVFDKFFRSKDERITDIKGSGLGLAFAREVARQHGGDLSIDSELHRGSTFTLRLPAGRAA